MQDLLGNKLSKGDLLFWVKNAVVCSVLEVNEPVLSIAGKSEGRQVPHLTIAITFPVPIERGEVEAMTSAFVKVVSPQSQSIMERLTGATRTQ